MALARDHHYVPQFFLKNFAVDPEAKKITTVAKHGSRAVWATRSIEHLGFERDLYVHLNSGVPLSVESEINHGIENPISKSDTWTKITSGRADALDRTDKPILYALIRHLEVRTPHYMETARELAKLAASSTSTMPFTAEERVMYAALRANPELAKARFNTMSATLNWTLNTYRGAGLSIFRSPIPLRSSTTPVLVLPAPQHPSIHLPLPGMVPFQLILTLNTTTIASLVLGDFDDAFENVEISAELAQAFNRHFVGQFAQFEHVRHLITARQALEVDMTWGPYDMISDTERKIIFQRRK